MRSADHELRNALEADATFAVTTCIAIGALSFVYLRKSFAPGLAVLERAVQSALKQRSCNHRNVSTFTNKRLRPFGQLSQYVTIGDVVDGKFTVERNGHVRWLRTVLSQLGRKDFLVGLGGLHDVLAYLPYHRVTTAGNTVNPVLKV